MVSSLNYTKEEALTETKILHLQLGEQPVKKKKYEKLDNCIVKLTEEYDGSNQSDFLKAIVFLKCYNY